MEECVGVYYVVIFNVNWTMCCFLKSNILKKLHSWALWQKYIFKYVTVYKLYSIFENQKEILKINNHNVIL